MVPRPSLGRPDFQHAVSFARREVLERLEQARVAARANLGVAELALRARFDLAALLHGHRKLAVADTEYRHAELEHSRRCAQLVSFVRGSVAARQDHALRRKVAHKRVVNVVRVKLAIHPGFAHAARDQLADLRAEVENQDSVVVRQLGIHT